MKLSSAAAFLSVLAGCQAYMPSQRLSGPIFSVLHSSATSSDAAFSAFADSLEVEPEPPKEKKTTWQSKLEDFLNPTTNPAEKQILFSELLSANDQIRESVMDAVASRKVGLVNVNLCVWGGRGGFEIDCSCRRVALSRM